MPQYKRLFVAGGTYFFTAVTHNRRPFLTDGTARSSLRKAVAAVQKDRPFDVAAIVLLPDHLHTVWVLPSGDTNYPERWRRIKELFTRCYLSAGGSEGVRSQSRMRQGERAVWQRRYWEHLCRDESDLDRCVDYVHWNPVKHGLARRPADYGWSTFRRYVEMGHYDEGWGTGEVADIPGAEWD